MIDYDSLTYEEIENLDISNFSMEELEDLKTYSARCSAHEQAIKLAINSIYGAFANEYFHFYNIAIAETVTLQGQDAIKFTEKMVDKYFKEAFHRDTKLLEYLDVPEGVEVPKIKGTVWKYTDTDSGYLIFEECMEAVNWQGGVKEFVIRLNNFRLAPFIKKVLDDYAKSFGVDNYLDFELETIAENAVWVAKKKYVQNIIWKDGKDYENLSYIKTTGLEIIQSSTPVFCREKLIEAVKFIFAQRNLFESNPELVALIKEIKREFKMSNIEKISMSRGISNYKKFVLNDTDGFELNKGCPIHVRAGAYHNYLLNKDSRLKQKYQLIQGGDKIKWYHSVDDGMNNNFGYKPGEYPVEIAPKIDYERQFQATIIDPLNRIIIPAGLPPINPSLAYTVGALW